MSDQPPLITQKIPRVFSAISAITGELSRIGIAKDRNNSQQGYKFRGIDQVYNTLSPLLAKHQLNILPQVQERTVTVAKSKADKDLYFVALKVNFVFVSAEDASHFIVTTYGEGMDSADKATNKALSAAYKYAVIQAFAIPVEGQPDADAETPTETVDTSTGEITPAPQAAAPLTPDAIETIKMRMKVAKLSEKRILAYFKLDSMAALTAEHAVAIDGYIKSKEAKSADQGQG